MIKLYKKRKRALGDFLKIINDASNVLVVCYSYANIEGEQISLSPMITAITIRSLDKNAENKYFSILKEAEKAGIEIEDIEDNYEELEYQVLNNFNIFAKKHKDYMWIHWGMNGDDYGFEAIMHRFDVIAKETNQDVIRIPDKHKFDISFLLENMYGVEYTKDADKMKSIMHENNFDTKSYLPPKKESEEFNEKNFSIVKESLNTKVDFLFFAIEQLEYRKLKIPNKNNYSIFIEFVSHPLFNLVGWIGTMFGALMTLK